MDMSADTLDTMQAEEMLVGGNDTDSQSDTQTADGGTRTTSPAASTNDEQDGTRGHKRGHSDASVTAKAGRDVYLYSAEIIKKTSSSYEAVCNVSHQCIGRIIGKQGNVIRELQEKTGATVTMPRDDQVRGLDQRPVTVQADSEKKVQHCCLLISHKIVPHDEQTRLQDIARELQAFEPTVKEHMYVPHNQVGRIIGKSGSTIKDIQNLSHTQIDLERDEPDGGTGDGGSGVEDRQRVLTITGSEAEVAYAKNIIRMKVTPKSHGGTAGPGPAIPVRDSRCSHRLTATRAICQFCHHNTSSDCCCHPKNDCTKQRVCEHITRYIYHV
eukprot:m.214074 g.214074  ORF g.214074 m.214074 type:complete len:327 (+) comp15094_c0_seq1:447-1427(+)